MNTKRRALATVCTAAAAVMTLLAGQAHAAVIWDGDASRGTGVFGHIGSNCGAPGSVTAVDESARGEVWRYRKPAGSNRCESRGIVVGGDDYTFTNGSTRYLGWASKLSSTVDNNAIFQWKSYGDHQQNWPVVLKMIGGKLTVIQRQPDGTVHTIWTRSVSAGAWNHIVIGLHLSDQTRGGWVELWFNGAKQTFNSGTQRWNCRTFDSENHPKWGVYGADSNSVDHYVDALKIGTSYGDVD
ncbi:polysaccharide lyase [Streptomyces sp. NBC_00457]|uniref:heparin lyase I family protein n=1 Tax=Streptomyces sp. NBC_00457 TaxID=2975748 RepID=UPI002E206DD8